MRLWPFAHVLSWVFAVPGFGANADLLELVNRVAQAEKNAPWFWSPPMEGLADLPYTYRQRITRNPARPSGELAHWRSVELERVPLAWGAFFRCVSEDGKSPCSKEWSEELERQTMRREQLTSEDRVRIDRDRQDRGKVRRAFWEAFPSAMHFEPAGPNEIRFAPRPESRATGGLLSAIAGRLRFDPVSYRLTFFEYKVIRTVSEPAQQLPKGSSFQVTLYKTAASHFVPQKVKSRSKWGRKTEEQAIEFSDFQLFDADSTVRFSNQSR